MKLFLIKILNKKYIFTFLLSLSILILSVEFGVYGGICPSSPCNSPLNDSHALGSGPEGTYKDFFVGIDYNYIAPLMSIPVYILRDSLNFTHSSGYSGKNWLDTVVEKNRDKVLIDEYNFLPIFLLISFFWILSWMLIFYLLKFVFEKSNIYKYIFSKKSIPVFILVFFVLSFVYTYWFLFWFPEVFYMEGEYKWSIFQYISTYLSK